MGCGASTSSSQQGKEEKKQSQDENEEEKREPIAKEAEYRKQQDENKGKKRQPIAKEAEYRKLFENGDSKEDSVPQEVYHCTLMQHANSILKEGFRFPIKGKTENRGWKLGYAAYFGMQPKYCIHEALNTFREEGKHPALSELAIIKVHVTKGKYIAMGDYERLPKKCGMSRDQFDVLTEMLDKSIVAHFGYDTITINEGNFAAEVAVYDKGQIGKMDILPAAQFGQ